MQQQLELIHVNGSRHESIPVTVCYTFRGQENGKVSPQLTITAAYPFPDRGTDFDILPYLEEHFEYQLYAQLADRLKESGETSLEVA